MISWNNLDTLESFKKLGTISKVSVKSVMSGESGADRVKKYSIPMACGMSFNYAAKAVDDDVLKGLEALAGEAQLADKFAALYNGEVINTGEK
nr:glucose-6-phosphate isomerase [Lachnospiraceae bacterium]